MLLLIYNDVTKSYFWSYENLKNPNINQKHKILNRTQLCILH